MLHVGDVPTYAAGEWTLTITGAVAAPFTIGLDELRALPSVDFT
ncbi:MAG: sulfite oxidase-like oxidoreductase, partial [Actinobacteria bacterium]|nr:sulfite oxidase-like oxidoreductase [Actinomycetota bacterium]